MASPSSIPSSVQGVARSDPSTPLSAKSRRTEQHTPARRAQHSATFDPRSNRTYDKSFADQLAELTKAEKVGSLERPQQGSAMHQPLEDRDTLGSERQFETLEPASLAFGVGFEQQTLLIGPSGPAPSAPAAAPANFGAMFEQFVTSMRVGKVGEQACVSLRLDVGGGAEVQVMIEETAVGPSIEVQSDSPTHALALERQLRKR